MKKLFFLICLCFPWLGGAYPHVLLKEPLNLQHPQGVCEGIFISEEKSRPFKEPLKLLGKAQITPLASSAKILQIVWMGVEHQGKQAFFEIPFQTVLKTTASTLQKETPLTLQGDLHQIERTLQAMSQEKTLQPRNAQNQKTTERRVNELKAASHPFKQRTGKSSTSSLEESQARLTSLERDQGNSKEMPGLSLEEGSESSSSSLPSSAFPSERVSRSSNFSGSGRVRENFPFSMASSPAYSPYEKGPPASQTSKPSHDPKIEVEVTSKGCPPRIDEIHDKVILQQRTLTKIDGRLEKETPCEDSHKVFDIQRDYLFPDCQDVLDYEKKVAYSTYRKYWMDEKGEKHWVSEEIHPDISKPHPFLIERSSCPYDLDLDALKAYAQGETVYYNWQNRRQKVFTCQRIHPQVPLNIEKKSCPPVHDFKENLSHLREKGVFYVDGAEHTAFPCQNTEKSVPHLFNSQRCEKIKDLSASKLIKTATRDIEIDGTKVPITTECEPIGEFALLSTSQGCEGHFEHDLEASQSYQKKRYYYLKNNTPKYVTKCLRSTEAYPHQVLMEGYRHDDKKKVSHPNKTLYIQTSLEKIKVPQVKRASQEIPYVFVEERLRENHQSFYLKGCHRYYPTDKIQVYQRADGTMFEEVIGQGEPLQGPDLCTRKTETRSTALPPSKHWLGFDGFYQQNCYSKVEEREVITYPDGHIEEGPWKETSQVLTSAWVGK